MNTYFIYILAKKKNSKIYIGVTNNLVRRIYEHKNNLIEGFTSKNELHNLVYFEQTTEILSAIAREKQLKNWHRLWKINLIESMNPIGMICMIVYFEFNSL